MLNAFADPCNCLALLNYRIASDVFRNGIVQFEYRVFRNRKPWASIVKDWILEGASKTGGGPLLLRTWFLKGGGASKPGSAWTSSPPARPAETPVYSIAHATRSDQLDCSVGGGRVDGPTHWQTAYKIQKTIYVSVKSQLIWRSLSRWLKAGVQFSLHWLCELPAAAPPLPERRDPVCTPENYDRTRMRWDSAPWPEVSIPARFTGLPRCGGWRMSSAAIGRGKTMLDMDVVSIFDEIGALPAMCGRWASANRNMSNGGRFCAQPRSSSSRRDLASTAPLWCLHACGFADGRAHSTMAWGLISWPGWGKLHLRLAQWPRSWYLVRPDCWSVVERGIFSRLRWLKSRNRRLDGWCRTRGK